jgi:hypothetical protein
MHQQTLSFVAFLTEQFAVERVLFQMRRAKAAQAGSQNWRGPGGVAAEPP